MRRCAFISAAHVFFADLVNESRKPYSHYVKLQENVLMGRLGRLYYKYLMANHLKVRCVRCFPPHMGASHSLRSRLKATRPHRC